MRKDPFNGEVKMHKGTDIPMPYGADVRTAGHGTVVSVGQVSGYGLQIVVDHGDGVTTRYAHLSSAAVQPGDTVARGQIIAASGNSGRSTGPHLHFEVLTQGRPIDPQGGQAAALLNQQ
jgi:murein DD-endopeptidase MepM/ murein hydrolase activator NlpD